MKNPKSWYMVRTDEISRPAYCWECVVVVIDDVFNDTLVMFSLLQIANEVKKDKKNQHTNLARFGLIYAHAVPRAYGSYTQHT